MLEIEHKLPRLLTTYQASAEQTERILGMATAARQELLPARSIIQRGTDHFQQRIRDIEEHAVSIRGFAPAAVFGVFQTEAYASVVFRQKVSGDQLARSVAARLERQRQLLHGSDRRWTLLQTEGALRWNLGGAAVMVEQLDHIVEIVGSTDHLRLGVVPWQATAQVLPLHGFHIYDFPGRKDRRDPRMVLVGTHSGTALLGEREAPEYAELFAELEHLAVFDDQALDLLRRIRDDYRRLDCSTGTPTTPKRS